MADLSAYIDFSVKLDKSGSTPVIKLTDPNNYPSPIGLYLTGIFSITQPDGISIDGSFTSPDIYSSGGFLTVASKELRLATDDSFQNGLYTLTYTIKVTGYTDTVKTKTFLLSYTQATIVISDLTDVFTPSLQEVDSTIYSQSGFTLSSVTRSWNADIKYVSSTVQTITGTSILFDMAYNSGYYDAHYSITLISTVTLVSTTYTWVSVIDKITSETQIDAYTPPTLAQLRASLTLLKQQIEQGTYCGSNCPCACEESIVYIEAVSLYEHIIARGQAGETVGLDAYVLQLQKIFNCSGIVPQAHTNAVLPPYDWGISVIIAPHTPIQFTVGSGGAFAPISGAVDYSNPTIAGNSNFNIYRQAVADFLVETTDFVYAGNGGFQLKNDSNYPNSLAFVQGERITLIFFTPS